MSVSRSIVILPPAPQSNPQSAPIRPRDDEFGLQPNAGLAQPGMQVDLTGALPCPGT